MERNLEEWVESEEFDQECATQFRKARERASVSNDSGDPDYENRIWSNSNDGASPSFHCSPWDPLPTKFPGSRAISIMPVLVAMVAVRS